MTFDLDLDLKVKFFRTFIFALLAFLSIFHNFSKFDLDALWPWPWPQDQIILYLYCYLSIHSEHFSINFNFDLDDLQPWLNGQLFSDLYFCVSSLSEHFSQIFKIWPWCPLTLTLTSRSDYSIPLLLPFYPFWTFFNKFQLWPWWPSTLTQWSTFFGPLFLRF